MALLTFTRKEKRISKLRHKQQTVSVSALKFVALYAVIAALCLFISSPKSGAFNWYLSVFWSLNFPIAVLGFSRIILSKKVIRSNFSGKTDKLVIFIVPTICRKDTLSPLLRVTESILRLAPANMINFRIDLIIEQDSEAKRELKKIMQNEKKVNIIEVPRNYTTPHDTKYKARANHFATELRTKLKENHPDVYIYHLDDDTHVGKDTISSIAEFIETEHGNKYLAQGILTFPYQLSTSWFCKRADGIRPIEDITRFKLFTGDLGTPLAGLHGEHLLIRADIEEEIGWDFGPTLAEDAYFGLSFAQKYPGKSASLNSYSYGASPANLRDFINQRKRWATGILGVVFDKRFSLKIRLPLLYSVFYWLVGLFQFVAVVFIASRILGVNNTSPVALWIIFLWSFNLAYHIWQYIEGNKINASVSTQTRKNKKGKHKKINPHPWVTIPLVYAITLIEGISAFLGMIQFIKKDFSFEVIKKEV
ncbi:MAG: glycosyltransferase family 2 protein [Candidatus Spechtbacterales bacterium]